MTTVLFKKYKHDRDDKFDDFLKALGISFVMRKLANSVTITVQLVKESDNTYVYKTTSSLRNSDMRFTLGEEFMEETLDGRNIPCVVTFEGNKMLQQQTGERATRIERTYTEDEMVSKCIFGDVVGYRYFKAVNE